MPPTLVGGGGLRLVLAYMQVRAHVEGQIALVAAGKADKGSVVAHTVEQFRAKFLFFVAKVGLCECVNCHKVCTISYQCS